MSNKSKRTIEERIGEKVSLDSPTVSVVIPIYNGSKYIAETLDSVFSQTYTDYEVFLVNDGSEDTAKLEDILKPYFNKLYYIKKENEGIAPTRNIAIEKARGKYLAFIDADDIWFPNYLEKQLKALESKKCDLIYADAFFFGEGIKEGEKYSDKAPSIGNVTTEKLISSESCVLLSGTFVLRELILKNGMFDKDVPHMGMEDFDLWFRLAKNGAKLDYQRDVLLKYRVHAESISGNRLNILERALTALEYIESRYELTQSEKEITELSKIKTQAEINLEKAKMNLIQEEYAKAISYFEKANRHFKKIKLKAVIIGLKMFPGFLLSFLQKTQPNEYGTIQSNRK